MATNQANYQIGLQFNANTGQARKELQSLQQELLKLSTGSNFNISEDIQKAKNSALQLASILKTSTNTDGLLNLTKFTQQIQQSGKSLSQFRADFSAFGKDGEKAFKQVANSVLSAVQPITQVNGLMGALWTSFKQTAKYQFTSSIYRGLIGGLRDAYSYAKDLNESLNNIRIVTGQSTEQMAKFAEEANKAAKELSVTTTQYTNGALIYYQQGLNDEEVKARTDVTMKLANASGVSAETASQQLTAIWNNFAKGSENLEYFADVMAALGASTASSTSEIAEGLEKFAAIGNTVGLSYEYAASALATVTATTRQSADVVGTAFKTLFARIQDLEVGETLEDGTTLGKYSQALATVGVNIKDANGELKAMDQILEEMAAAWGTISKDQQVALAQTVAGTRQYTQLVALMENWSFMQKNLQTSYDSTGTVQKQADIYAESWEAARARAKAAAEGIFDQLLDDTFFIELTNNLSKVINFIGKMIDDLGGLKTVLPLIGSLFLTIFNNQISASLSNVGAKLSEFFGLTTKLNTQMREQAVKELYEGAGIDDGASPSAAAAQSIINIKNEEDKIAQNLIKNGATLSQQEKEKQLLILNQIRAKHELARLEDENLQQINEEIGKQKTLLDFLKDKAKLEIQKAEPQDKSRWAAGDALLDYSQGSIGIGVAKTAVKDLISSGALEGQGNEEIKKLAQQFLDFKANSEEANKAAKELSEKIVDMTTSAEQANEVFKKISSSKSIGNISSSLKSLGNITGQITNFSSNSEEEIKNFVAKIRQKVDNEVKVGFGRYENPLAKALMNFDNVDLKNPEKVKEFFNNLIQAADEAEKKLTNTVLPARLKELGIETNLTGKELEDFIKKQLELAKASGESEEKIRKLEEIVGSLGKISSQQIPQTIQLSQAFTRFSTGLTSVATLVNSLRGAVELLENDNKKIGEKLLGLLPILGTLIFSITSIKNGIDALNTRLVTTPALLKLAAGSTNKTSVAFAKWFGITVAEDGALQAVNLTLGKLLLKLLPFIAIIGLLTLGIVGIVKALNADADAAEKASEKAKELTENYNELKTANEELKQSISNYDDGIQALKNLQVGTDQYKEKLKETNEEARKLIENNKNLQNKWQYNAKTGAIEFDKNALKEIQEENSKKLSQAQENALAAQIAANNYSNKNAQTQLKRSDDTNLEDYMLNAAQGALAGTTISLMAGPLASLFMPFGAAVGAITGLAGAIDAQIEKQNQEQAWIEELEKAYQSTESVDEAIRQASEKIGVDFTKSLGGSSTIAKYLNEIKTKQDENLQLLKQIVDNRYSNNEDYKNTSEDIKDLLATSLSTQVSQKTENYKGLTYAKGLTSEERKGFAWGIFGNKSNNQLTKAAYGRMMGYEVGTNFWGATTLTKIDSNGNAQKVTDVPIEYMRTQLAQNKALEEVENSIKNTGKTIEEALKSLTSFGLSRENGISFLESWANGKTGNLGNFTQQQLTNFDASQLGITDEIAIALGHKSADALVAEIKNRAEQDKEAFGRIGENMAPVVQQAIKEAAKNTSDEFIYTLFDSQAIANALNSAFISGGTEGVNSLKQLLASTNDPAGLIQAFEDIDWRTADFDSLKKKLKELNINFSEDALKTYYEDAKQAATETYYLTTSLEDLLKTYKEIDDIIGKLDFGSVITPEQYETLIKYNEALKDFFALTLNGYKFLGTSEDMEGMQESFWEEQADNYAKNQNTLDKLQNSSAYFTLNNNFSNRTIASNYSGLGNSEFNEAAGRLAEVSKEALQEALKKAFDEDTGEIIDEEAAKIVNKYAEALLEIDKTWGDKFSSRNFVTSYIDKIAKSSDEFDEVWKEFLDKFGDRFNDLKDYEDEAKNIAFTNELASKGIDLDKYKDYYRYLQGINNELIQNEQSAKKVALANLMVQKGLENLNSNFESYIEGLTEAVGSAAHQQALDSIRQDLADILSVEVEDLYNIDEVFIAEHQNLIELASQGNQDALLQLEILSAQVMDNLTEKDIEYLKQLQEQVANSPIGTTIAVDLEFTERAKHSLDAIGLEIGQNGEWVSQGRWPQRANLQTLQNKSADKAGKSKTLKSIDDEIDRYHYIRKLLADIERELDRVDKAKERAYGAQHLKYIEQETDYLREQVGLQDRYINEIEGYLAKDRGLIAAYGAQFDAAGNISNYNQLFTSNFNKYANAEDSTNWENFKKALSKYEETLDLWFEQTEEKAELLRQILDKQLEGISYKVEVEVALDDREIALLEHQLNRLDDAAYDTAAALANIGEQFKNTEDSVKSTTNGIVEVLKTIPGITQDQINRYLAGDGDALAGLHIEQGQIELLEQYSDQLLELSDRLKELHDSALQKVTEAFDAWGEKIEDHVAKFEHLNNVLNNYEEIIGILGRNNLGISNEFMRAMRNQEIINLQSILNTRTQTKDVLTAQLADARQKASEAATEAEREDWEQVVTDLEGRLREATESWQQAWIDALQANKEAFEQTMQELVDSFDDYADELKRYDTAEDRYLETYRQAYELSKLGRDIQNSINDQDSIRAKKELQKLEDKINALKESGRAISENELGLLQKEYELRLAEIALEDAQNAKSLVRLERDNEGNWGYVYTADQENIEKARQDYEDKLYEYMRLADTMAEESSRAILTLNKEMAEALAALDVNAVDYEAKVAEITQFYTDQINYFAEQYGISTDAINTVAKESAAKYKPEVVDIIESDNSGLQTNFDETVLAIIGDFEDLEDAINGPDGALPNIQRAYSETLTAFENYQIQNAETCRLAGSNVEDMATVMKTAFDNIKRETKETDGATKEMAENMKSYLDDVLNNFGDFAGNYSSKVKIVSDANTALATSIIGLKKTLNNIDTSSLESLKKAADQVEAIAQKVKEVSNSADNDNESIKTGGLRVIKTSYEIKPGDMTYHYLVEYYSDGTTTKTTQRHRWVGGGAGEVCPECSAMRALNPNAYKNAPDYIKWVPVNFDTGGYTGEWGSTGRLAVLHEKELILNKEDTSNILDAVSLIRQMTAGTAQLSYGLGNIGAGLANLNLSPGTMDQNVNISASFPNVVNHNEIEEALTNLVNKASQYAFRPNLT